MVLCKTRLSKYQGRIYLYFEAGLQRRGASANTGTIDLCAAICDARQGDFLICGKYCFRTVRPTHIVWQKKNNNILAVFPLKLVKSENDLIMCFYLSNKLTQSSNKMPVKHLVCWYSHNFHKTYDHIIGTVYFVDCIKCLHYV